MPVRDGKNPILNGIHEISKFVTFGERSVPEAFS